MTDINSYVWKDARITKDKNEKQVTTRLVDMTEDQLQMVYTHCKNMLYNSDPKNEGRMIILDNIVQQKNKCGAELAYRWFKNSKDKDGNLLFTDDTLIPYLRSLVRAACGNESTDSLNYELQYFLKVPANIKDVPIGEVINACKDNLGIFNHSKITRTFIYTRVGVYLTQEELTEIDSELMDANINLNNVTLQNKIDNHIKFPLGISEIPVKINPKGLTGAELRDMVHLKKFGNYKTCKYSDLSTSQLTTLRNKVLPLLKERTQYQVDKWKEIMSQIEEVAKHYGISLF